MIGAYLLNTIPILDHGGLDPDSRLGYVQVGYSFVSTKTYSPIHSPFSVLDAATPKPEAERGAKGPVAPAFIEVIRRGIFQGTSHDIITCLFAKTTSGSGLLRLISLTPKFGSTVLPLSSGRYA